MVQEWAKKIVLLFPPLRQVGEVHSELVIFWPVKAPEALSETAIVVLSLRSLAHKELNTQIDKKGAVWGNIFVSLSQAKLPFHRPGKSGPRD